MIWLFSYGPLRNYRQTLQNQKPPQIIFVLGGDIEREYIGARLAKALDLPLLVSGGSNPEHAKWLAEKAKIAKEDLTLDYRAKDTFGNFSTLVDDLAKQKVNHALLITSEDHFSRAMMTGNVIAGSRGIRLTGISVSCKKECIKESFQKKYIDLIRSIIWVLTGKDIKKLAEVK